MKNEGISGLRIGIGVLVFAGAAVLGGAKAGSHGKNMAEVAAQKIIRDTFFLEGEDAVRGGENKILLGSSDRHMVIAFVSTRCLCSPDQMMALKDLDARYSRRGFKFVAVDVSQDSTREERSKYYREFSFPILFDKGFRIADRFHAEKTPWIQVVDSKGTSGYAGTVLGPDGDALLEPALQDIAAGREPSRVKDKRFGCAIRTMVLAPDDTDGSMSQDSLGQATDNVHAHH